MLASSVTGHLSSRFSDRQRVHANPTPLIGLEKGGFRMIGIHPLNGERLPSTSNSWISIEKWNDSRGRVGYLSLTEPTESRPIYRPIRIFTCMSQILQSAGVHPNVN